MLSFSGSEKQWYSLALEVIFPLLNLSRSRGAYGNEHAVVVSKDGKIIQFLVKFHVLFFCVVFAISHSSFFFLGTPLVNPLWIYIKLSCSCPFGVFSATSTALLVYAFLFVAIAGAIY